MTRALSIVLVAPEIHWNTGNLGRTSLAVGADLHLVEPLGFSLAEREVRRAGLDYWPRVRLTVWPDWAQLARALPGLGEPFFFTAAAPRDYWEVRYPARTVLVLGRESVGSAARAAGRPPGSSGPHPDGRPRAALAEPVDGRGAGGLRSAAAVVRHRQAGNASQEVGVKKIVPALLDVSSRWLPS